MRHASTKPAPGRRGLRAAAGRVLARSRVRGANRQDAQGAAARATERCGLARCRTLARVERGGRRPADQAARAVRAVRVGARRPGVQRGLEQHPQPVLRGRPAGGHAGFRLAGCVGACGAGLRGARAQQRGRRRRGELRARARPAPGREGHGPQLPGHLGRGRRAAGLDARDEPGHRARRLRARGLRRNARARPRRHGRVRGRVDRPLSRRDDRSRTLRAGRRLRRRRRRGPGAERRLR
jgi:hypothetical protein